MKAKKLPPLDDEKYHPRWVKQDAQIMIRQEYPENHANSVDEGPMKLYP